MGEGQRQRLSCAVRKSGSHAGVLEGLDFGVSMFGRHRIVRPVMYGRNSRQETFGDAEAHALVRILRRAQRADADRKRESTPVLVRPRE